MTHAPSAPSQPKPQRPLPRILTVKTAYRLTPNMIRVTFAGPELAGLPEGRVQTCIAGESGVIRSLRAFLHQEKALARADTYISGYWKIGLVEDQHQAMKRAEG